MHGLRLLLHCTEEPWAASCSYASLRRVHMRLLAILAHEARSPRTEVGQLVGFMFESPSGDGIARWILP